MEHSKDRIAHNELQAALLSVKPDIHPDDHIYNFLMDHGGFPDDKTRIRYYFVDGGRSANKLTTLISQYLPDVARPRVLEFASGYGCITRHLLAKADALDIVSCDIHEAAIDFLRNRLGGQAQLSASIPEKLDTGGTYDIVFALSFFSHMPVTTWARWLVRLCDAVHPGGIVAFTTQGRLSMPFVGCETLPDLGFWYRAMSEQHDIPVEEYGQTVIAPELVRRMVGTIADVVLLDTREGFWWDHQDLYVIRRTA